MVYLIPINTVAVITYNRKLLLMIGSYVITLAQIMQNSRHARLNVELGIRLFGFQDPEFQIGLNIKAKVISLFLLIFTHGGFRVAIVAVVLTHFSSYIH